MFTQKPINESLQQLYSKSQKQTNKQKHPNVLQLDKQTVVHLDNGILFSNKITEPLIRETTWMDLEDIRQNERNESHKKFNTV